MAGFTQDLRSCFRLMRRSPGFVGVAVLLLSLGLAASSLIFTLVDALLLRPLPVRDAGKLLQLFEQQPKRPADPYFAFGFFQMLQRDSATLYNFAGQVDTTRALTVDGHTDRIHAVAVTGDFFTNLGIDPLLGRVLRRNDDHVAVLSFSYWARAFGSDPHVIGKTVRLQEHAYTIAGVTPEAFTGTAIDSSPDLWMPYANLLDFSRNANTKLDSYVIEIVASLKAGRQAGQAQQEAAALWARYLQQTGSGSADSDAQLLRGRLEVRSLAHGISPMRDQSQTVLLLLLGGTGLLLLMVCANVGGLLLARATACEQETAIRIALGASRWQIQRQWLVESLFLTLTGGVTGGLVARASLPFLMSHLPPAHGTGFDPSEMRTLALQTPLDFRVVGFSLLVCGLTAILCALAPALSSLRSNANPGSKAASGERRHGRFQAMLCGIQIALCTSLLVSTGWMSRSWLNLQRSDAGFEWDRVAVFSIDPHVRSYDSRRLWALQQRLLDGVKHLPGVAGAALADRALLRGIGLGTSVVFPGQTGGIINSSVNSITPEYFSVMGIRLLQGRNFRPSDQDQTANLKPVIVNEAFFRKFIGKGHATGKRFGVGKRFAKAEYEIIGVVNDTKYRSLREIPPPVYYTCGFGPQAYPDTFVLQVKSRGNPQAVVEPVRQFVRSLDPELPVYEAATFPEEVGRSLWQERLLVALSSCFGTFALALAMLGLYGTLAYFVARRRKDVAVRIALGAKAGDVIRVIAGRMLPTMAAGTLAGALLSWGLSVFVRGILYGVAPFDPITIVAAACLLVSAGVAGRQDQRGLRSAWTRRPVCVSNRDSESACDNLGRLELEHRAETFIEEFHEPLLNLVRAWFRQCNSHAAIRSTSVDRAGQDAAHRACG